MGTQTKTTRPLIDLTRVFAVYSGRPGICQCGCAGIHRFARALREQGGRDRGYPVGDEEVNDIQVRKVVAILNGLSPSEVEVQTFGGATIYGATVDGRAYTVRALPGRLGEGTRVKVKPDAVPVASEASWMNGMVGVVVLDDAGFSYEVELRNGQRAFLRHEQLECVA